MTQQGGQRAHWPTAGVQVSGTFYGAIDRFVYGLISLPCSSPDASLSHRETLANTALANVFEFEPQPPVKAKRLVMDYQSD